MYKTSFIIPYFQVTESCDMTYNLQSGVQPPFYMTQQLKQNPIQVTMYGPTLKQLWSGHLVPLNCINHPTPTKKLFYGDVQVSLARDYFETSAEMPSRLNAQVSNPPSSTTMM